MRKIRDVLRLHAKGHSNRKIARSLSISRDSVTSYLTRAQAAGLSWPLPHGMDDHELEQRLFPPVARKKRTKRPQPDWEMIYQAMKEKGATLQQLHLEYLEEHPDGLAYSSFCEGFRDYKKTMKKYMRQDYRAGEKVFVDYSGKTMPIHDPRTGDVKQAQIFVGVLGASNYTFAFASWTQNLEDWIEAHIRMFEFFGGVPECVVCDNLKAAVTKVRKSDPVINQTYLDMARHYGTMIFPARPYKPQDKAKAENGVQLVERWILFRLRHKKFTSLNELNTAIAELLHELNSRDFKQMPGSRKSMFESIDKPELLPLPPSRYELACFPRSRVMHDYHISIDGCRYSVPHTLVGKNVESRVTRSTIEIFFNGRRVAIHPRLHEKNGVSTNKDHMPANHRHLANWDKEEAIKWAASIGLGTQTFLRRLISETKNKYQAYRIEQSLRKLHEEYGDRLEAASRRAVKIRAIRLASLRSILSNNLDFADDSEGNLIEADFDHENIRGPDYYK